MAPYLPQNQYKIRNWLKPDGLLLLFKTEEMARRVKSDLEMRDPEFAVDFWAIRPEEKGMPVEEKPVDEKKEVKPVVKEEEKIKETNSFASLAEH